MATGRSSDAPDDREARRLAIERFRAKTRKLPKGALARAVTALVEYLWNEEEDFLNGDHDCTLRTHIFGSVLAADRWLRLRRARRRAKAREERERERRLDGLEALANALSIREEDLDDAVHDAMSAEAAEVDNSGLREQLAFLLDSHGGEVRELEEFLRGLTKTG